MYREISLLLAICGPADMRFVRKEGVGRIFGRRFGCAWIRYQEARKGKNSSIGNCFTYYLRIGVNRSNEEYF